jgi:acyl-CoA synthetase (AMP-forming)/AMP-acid ligase II
MHESGRAASVIVDPDSRRRVGTGGNGMIDLDGVATVADVLRVQARRRPDAVALEFEGRATTFAEIDALASRIANQLIGSGVAPQERIAYLAKNSDHFFGFLFGACKARVALAPINFASFEIRVGSG